MARIFIVTGEASGDLHGAHLAIALRKLQADVELVGVGGEHMRAAGVTLLSGLERVDGMGVLGFNQIRKGLANLRTLKHYLQQEAFDAIVLIDNPGMNLRLAKIAARFGHRIIYYIAPQIWAWGRRRIHLIKRVINRVIVILPFEKAIYDEAKVPCDYVGHPLLDSMAPTYDQGEVRRRLGVPEQGLVIGVLPGSRVHEVETLLPEMLQAFQLIKSEYPDARCVIGKAHSISELLLERFLSKTDLAEHTITPQSNDVMAASDLLLVASGTTTLQAGLIGTPMIIAYRVSWLTFRVAKMIGLVNHIGLVNLVAGKGIVPELLQEEAVASRLSQEALRLLKNRDLYDEMRESFKEVRAKMGAPGASKRAAQAILKECQT